MKRVFFFCFVLALGACSPSDDDIESKTEWGNLQSVSQNFDGKALSTSEIVSREGMSFFCVVSPDSPYERVWILLHPNSPPYYKQMPEGSYNISKEDYQKVQASGLASSTVLAVLSSHITFK